MLFYYYTVLFKAAGTESEIYAFMDIGGSSDGDSGCISRTACVHYSSVWHRGQYEWSLYYVYCLYCDDFDGSYIDCFQTGQEGQKAGAGNGNDG